MRYGRFYKRRRKFDASLLPSELQPLVPYAEVWGEADDHEREELVDSAPEAASRDLFALFQDKVLYRATVAWLARAADTPLLQSEVFSAVASLLVAFDSIKALLDWEGDQ